MKRQYLLITAIFLIILGILFCRYAEKLSNKYRYVQNVKSVLSSKQLKTINYFKLLETADEGKLPGIIEKSNEDGIILLVYNADSLVFWSSNSIPIYEIYIEDLLRPRVVKLLNSYYYLIKQTQGEKIYVGLITLFIKYPYENDFLSSGFTKDFRLPEAATLSLNQGNGYGISDDDGAYLFTVQVPDSTDPHNPRIIIGLFLLLVGFALLSIFAFLFIANRKSYRERLYASVAVIVSALVLRALTELLSFDFTFFALFDPYLYANSAFVENLADLLINSLIIFYIILIINRFASLPFKNSVLVQGVFYIVYFLIFTYSHYYSLSLIFNSNISFRPNEIDQLSVYTFLSVLIIGINYMSAAIFYLWILKAGNETNSLRKQLFLIISLAVLFFIILFVAGYSFDILSIVFFCFFTAFFFILFYKKIEVFQYSVWTIFLIIFSIYLISFLSHESGRKEEKVRSSLALSLSNEHDPVAEYLLRDISNSLANDTLLQNIILSGSPNIQISNYLKKNYFKGYWNKYDMIVTICDPLDSVLIEVPEYQWFHCYNFFGQIIRDVGLKLPNSKFYYLDDFTGQISYMGKFSTPIDEFPYEISFYIELDSKLSNDFLGYPELLLDKNLQGKRQIDQYSYAKYHNNELIARHGEYNYSLSPHVFGNLVNEAQLVEFEGYSHFLYKSNNINLIVLSIPEIRFIDLLIGFAYIFLIFYISMLAVFAVRNLQNSGSRFLADLRSKMQFTILTVLLVSMILIAVTTIWLSIRNYKNNQERVLHEKIQSILVELTRRIGLVDELNFDWSSNRYDNLNQLLIRYSDAYFTDINLYYPSGELMATSRKEIFQLGLQGDRIDPVALYKLKSERRAQFIHPEKIGDLAYQSAYVPFENSSGKLLAYLNLPYFTKQTELQTALSTLIVTIVNIYVILILLTILATIFISNQITRPLNMLQQRFRQLKLGDRYEQIQYFRDDEIRPLVEEYNKMVIELEKSFELLARSERESAWREMAKQIAHEIKNPLTPMRLSVQQLQKLWKEKRGDFDSYLNNVTTTLIEQIDNLSAIASEFSNFAKMPAIKIARVNLVEIISKTVELFGENDEYRVNFETEMPDISINGDREQLSRVFMNLLKNAVQSIPDGRKGIINVVVGVTGKQAFINISDNGTGIPDEVQQKLFTPNFTTKSSGMGLGLSIVKNIIDQHLGEITYETSASTGTQFTIKLPVVKVI